MNNKKKILILIEWFVPGYKAGGPISSCFNLCMALRENYEIFVLTTDTDHGDENPYPGLVSDKWLTNAYNGINVFYGKKKHFNSTKLIQILNELKADYIYLNLLFSPLFVIEPLWLKLWGKIDSKIIVCPRGCLYDSALSLKWYKKRPLLILYRWAGVQKKITFHATNEREEEAIEKYFPAAETVLANNLPDSDQKVFETYPKLVGTIKCIFIARIVPIKNLLYIIKILSDCKANVLLTVAGPIENEIYWNECKTAIAKLPSNINVDFLGPKPKNELPELVKSHHLFVLPTTGENFGHAIFDALLYGRPVLISDQTPWLQLKKYNAGWDLPLSEPLKFLSVIEELTACNQHQFDIYAKAAWEYAANFIANSTAKNQYLKLFS